MLWGLSDGVADYDWAWLNGPDPVMIIFLMQIVAVSRRRMADRVTHPVMRGRISLSQIARLILRGCSARKRQARSDGCDDGDWRG